MSTFTHAVSTNNYGTAKFIVSSSAANGTHTTIASALTSATSGDTIFIRPGTYTENLTLKAGVNLAAYDCDALNGNVVINGTCTFTESGSVDISGIRLKTNSAALLAVTGSNPSVVNLKDCYLQCSDNTGITFSASNASALISIFNCKSDIETTGITLFSMTSTGLMVINNLYGENSGNTTTASNVSSSLVTFYNSDIFFPLSTSSSGSVNFFQGVINTSAINTAVVTTAGTGQSTITNSFLTSGTASCVSAGASTGITLDNVSVISSNTNAAAGAGTLNYGSVTFAGTSNLISSTTQSCFNSSSFTPTLNFGGGTTGITYSIREGVYLRIMNMCYFSINIALSSKGSSTGNANISGLPFTPSSAISTYNIPGEIFANTPPALTIDYMFQNSGASFNIFSILSNGGTAQHTNAEFGNSTVLRVQGFYFI